MKYPLLFLLISLTATGKEISVDDKFREEIKNFRATYRETFSKELFKADIAIVYLVKFDAVATPGAKTDSDE